MLKAGLQRFVARFDAPIGYAFAYGSGVLSQGTGQKTKKTQIDLIFAVENAQEWHHQNIAQHPGDYSSLRHLGSGTVAAVQDLMGAGVYFNPYVPMDGRTVKYGVVSLPTLIDDLNNWSTLYLAGRLHKPVKTLVTHQDVAKAQEKNLQAAMAVALLLLPHEFSEYDLYTKIAGVSYLGDVRMALAENPHKVRNIVSNQFAHFRRLYAPLFSRMGLEHGELAGIGPDAHGTHIFQPGDEAALISVLPVAFQARLGGKDVTRLRVANAVRRTVKWPSVTQSTKGIITAGIGRSTSYAIEKLKKRWL